MLQKSSLFRHTKQTSKNVADTALNLYFRQFHECECVINIPFILAFKPIIKTSKEQKQKKLSHTAVAWITGGICIGAILIIIALAILFNYVRKRYSGKFLARHKDMFDRKYYGGTGASLNDISQEHVTLKRKEKPRGNGAVSL